MGCARQCSCLHPPPPGPLCGPFFCGQTLLWQECFSVLRNPHIDRLPQVPLCCTLLIHCWLSSGTNQSGQALSRRATQMPCPTPSLSCLPPSRRVSGCGCRVRRACHPATSDSRCLRVHVPVLSLVFTTSLDSTPTSGTLRCWLSMAVFSGLVDRYGVCLVPEAGIGLICLILIASLMSHCAVAQLWLTRTRIGKFCPIDRQT